MKLRWTFTASHLPASHQAFWFDFTVYHNKTGPEEGMEGVWTHFWGKSSSDTRQGAGKLGGPCGTPGQMRRRQAKSDSS